MSLERQAIPTGQTPGVHHSVSVAAVIVNAVHRVLVVQRRDNSHWEPPGGVLELGETIEEGLRREVREETGYEIEIEAQTGVYKNMHQGIIALVFRCQLIGGHPCRVTAETRAVRWLDPSQVALELDEAYSVRVLDALDHGPPAIRAHDGRNVLTGSTSGGIRKQVHTTPDILWDDGRLARPLAVSAQSAFGAADGVGQHRRDLGMRASAKL